MHDGTVRWRTDICAMRSEAMEMKILVATDGSKPSLHAVKYALKLLLQLREGSHSITLISVHDDTALRHAKAIVGHEAVDEYLVELSEKDLKAAKKMVESSGMRHFVEIRTGHVAQEIVAFAKHGRFDLVAMGSKGRGAISDLLLGSVAQRVLATSAGPVLLIP